MLHITEKQNKVREYRVTLGGLLEEYTQSLLAMNRSPKTISWYLEILGRYLAFLDSHKLLKAVGQLGRQELQAYILHLQEVERWPNNHSTGKPKGNLSPYSVQGHVRAIKAFWGWLKREEYTEKNSLAIFPLPKVPEKPVGILSMDQIRKLLTHIDRYTPVGARSYVMLMLLLDTGIRVSELVSIRMEDLDLQHGCIRVLGKGQKVRSVPMSKLTKKEVTRYIRHTDAQIYRIDSPYLFAKSDGTPVSVNSVQQFLRRLARKAGLKGIRCSPHVFRHTFATQSVANGANVFVLKEIMGHSNLNTTMKYTHLQPHDLQIQHAKFSPVVTLATTMASGRKYLNDANP